MKFKVTDWIEHGNIAPLNWGDDFREIQKLFPSSKSEIENLRQRNYPFIILDFVEFYFSDDTNYNGLTEIIIKAVSLDKTIKTKFINPGWLTNDMTRLDVSVQLTQLGIDWKIEFGPHFGTPNIRTKSNILFAFDSDEDKADKAELMKIYLSQQDSSQHGNYFKSTCTKDQ